jgi:hypothetical protein
MFSVLSRFSFRKIIRQGVIWIHPLTFKIPSRILWKKSKPAGDVLCHILPSFDAKNLAK